MSTLVGALVGAPFAYTLAGVVLGDVGPIEALRRSFRVFGARRGAAFLVVLFESVAFLLVVLGLDAGLGLVIRAFEAVGLRPEAGGIGLVLTALVAAAIVFASGTLLFTVYALTVAPQVVMFVGLTHATFGLDRVRPGGRDDPHRPRLRRAEVPLVQRRDAPRVRRRRRRPRVRGLDRPSPEARGQSTPSSWSRSSSMPR